jgi:RNA polymerase sigma-70 factor (sigma-E family)
VKAVTDASGRIDGVRTDPMGTGARTTAEPTDAFGAAMVEHGPRLARLAFYLCGDRTRAEDLVAEAFAAAWPKWSTGRIETLLPYLRRALVNLAAKDRRHWLVVFRHDEREGPPPMMPGADEGLWVQVDLARALASLPSAQRVVVVLRYLEDLSEFEIATLLGTAPGTVKSRLARALATLRTHMQGSDDA